MYRSLVVTTESLDDVGFDQINRLNTTSGQLDGFIYNLADSNILLECTPATVVDGLKFGSDYDVRTKC